MRKLIIICLAVFTAMTVQGQTEKKATFTSTIGMGIAMNAPSCTPFEWQVIGQYNISKRFSAGIGTGISVYEKALIPVFADAKFLITRPHRFTPYVECGIGYAFAPSKDANGGFYLNPAIGVQYALKNKMKILLAVGYESQYMERLKKCSSEYIESEFNEKLTHHSISFKIGFLY